MVLTEYFGPDGVIELIVVLFIRCVGTNFCVKLIEILLYVFHTYVTDVRYFWKLLPFYCVFLLKRTFYVLQYFLMYLRLPLFKDHFSIFFLRYSFFHFVARYFSHAFLYTWLFYFNFSLYFSFFLFSPFPLNIFLISDLIFSNWIS